MGKDSIGVYQIDSLQFNDVDGTDEDDDEIDESTRKRVRKESAVASKKLLKDEPVAKLKKKARVLVEVMVIILVDL